MTYYKYAEKKATDFVDWGKISTDINADIQKALTEREERRRTLDKEYMDAMKVIADSPQVDQVDAKAWLLNTTNGASRFLYDNYNLMRKGKMKPADFTVIRQNVQGSMTQLQNDIKTWEAKRKERIAKVLGNKLSSMTEAQYDLLDRYTDLSTTSPVFDARTGYLFYTKPGAKDGDPASILSGNNFFKLNNEGTEVERFDMDKWVKMSKDKVGVYADIKNRGGVGIVKSALQNPDYKNAEEAALNELVNPNNQYSVVDILTKSLGGYEVVWGEPKNDKQIKVVIGSNGFPQAELTEGQLKAAKEFARQQLRVSFDVDRSQAPQPTRTNQKGLSPDQKQAAILAQQLVMGDLAAATTALRTKNQKISTVSRNDQSIIITYNDGTPPLTINHGGNLQTFLNNGGANLVGSSGLGTEIGDYNVSAGNASQTYPTPNFGSKDKETLIREVELYFKQDGARLDDYLEDLRKNFGIGVRRSTFGGTKRRDGSIDKTHKGKPALEGYGVKVLLDEEDPAKTVRTFLRKVPGN